MAPDDSEQNEDSYSESDASPSKAVGDKRPRTQRELPPPNRKISPLDLRFSQMRARHEFRDAKPLEESADLVKAVRCEDSEGFKWRLEAPFPPIEVLQWRCKLRDETTGRPKMDPATGEEMWDNSDRWFTLDNRRLYCLQKAAIKVYPDQAYIDVVELPSSLQRLRELKKFRTDSRGRSIYIGGRREGETLVRWSWREAIGLPAAPDGQDSDETQDGQEGSKSQGTPPRPGSADGDRVQLRSKKKYTTGGKSHADIASDRVSQSPRDRLVGKGAGKGAGGKRRGADTDEEESTGGRFSQMSWGSLVVFLGIYVFLRFATKLVTVLIGDSGKKATDAVTLASEEAPLASTLITGAAAALIATCVVHMIRKKIE